MNHPLPPRPNFIPSSSSSSTAGPSNLKYQLPTPISAVPSPAVKPSAPPIDPMRCSSCSSSTPKYTCPRCSKRSCSLECTKKHKSTDKCSGVRDPTSFVPLTAYGQGAWSDDYKWLEEGRRKVTEWGENVGFQELMDAAKKPAHNPRNGRERNMNKIKKRNSRKELLKRELLMGHNCSIEFMPVGMEKKKANQSSWNPKTKQLQITIHLNIPSHLLDPSSSSSDFKTITHPRVLFASPSTSKSLLPVLSSLITPSPSTKVIYLLPFQSTPSRPAPEHTKGQKLFYPPLNPSKPVAEALGGTAWVEFPVIEIMETTRWDEGVKNGEYMVIPLSEPVISLKDRTRDSGWGKRKIDNVDNREGEERQSPKKAKIDGKGLMALGDYASDDEDDVEADLDAEEGDDDEDDVTIEGDYQEDEDEGEEGEEEPSIEVLRAVGAALAADLG